MTPADARTEISRVGHELSKAELIVDLTFPVLRRDGSEVIVTWPADAVPLSDLLFGTIQEYRSLVLGRQYTCVLIDGALLQFSFAFNRAAVIRSRLCYYPCPVELSEMWDPEEMPLIDLFDELLSDELDGLLDEDSPDRLKMRSPLRFDYSPEQQNVMHPASHIHLGDENVRIPVFGPLSIGHFLRFVVRNFYPQTWEEVPVFRKWPQSYGARCITEDEEIDLYLDCRLRIPVGGGASG